MLCCESYSGFHLTGMSFGLQHKGNLEFREKLEKNKLDIWFGDKILRYCVVYQLNNSIQETFF